MPKSVYATAARRSLGFFALPVTNCVLQQCCDTQIVPAFCDRLTEKTQRCCRCRALIAFRPEPQRPAMTVVQPTNLLNTAGCACRCSNSCARHAAADRAPCGRLHDAATATGLHHPTPVRTAPAATGYALPHRGLHAAGQYLQCVSATRHAARELGDNCIKQQSESQNVVHRRGRGRSARYNLRLSSLIIGSEASAGTTPRFTA